MVYWLIIGVLIVIVCLIVYSFRRLHAKDSSTDISSTLITTGISLVISAFPGTKEIIASIIASVFSISVSVEDNFVAILCGFILITLGLILRKDIKDRVFVLNMFGIFVQKEISDAHNIKALKLADFKVKEIIVDFVDLFNNSKVDEERNELIVKKIIKQCEAFSNRSKDFKSCYTGMAPIPYTILAGTKLSDCNLKRFFEFKRSTNSYYELKSKDRVHKHEILQVNYPQPINPKLNDVVVALSITKRVQKADLSQFEKLDIIDISINNPRDNVVETIEQLDDYGNTVLNAIEEIKLEYPQIDTIHLVASIPSCISIKLGMLFALSNNRIPRIISYHFIQGNQPKYPFGIVVSDINSDDTGRLISIEGR